MNALIVGDHRVDLHIGQGGERLLGQTHAARIIVVVHHRRPHTRHESLSCGQIVEPLEKAKRLGIRLTLHQFDERLRDDAQRLGCIALLLELGLGPAQYRERHTHLLVE